MAKTPIIPDPLRTAAEARLSQDTATDSPVRSAEELLHKIQLHQIELELQNEELRRAYVILDESRDRYIELYDFAPVGYLTLTCEGLIAELNLTAAGLLGVDRFDLLNRRFAAFVTPQDGDLWHLFFVGVLKRNKPQNIELTLKRNDGVEFPVQLDCKCVITANQSSMLRITLTDITEIKKTEAALREAKEIAMINAARMQTQKVREEALNRLQKIASQLPGVIFQFRLYADGRSCCPYASEAIRDIYRLSPEEVREDASRVFALLHPDDYDAIIASIRKSERDLSPWCYEYRVKFDDGTVRWLLGNALLQREADGSTLWFGFITDISERKQAEQQLRIAAIAFESQNGILITDTNATILQVNRSFTKITGYCAEETIGRNTRMLSSGRHSKAFYAAMWNTLNTTDAWEGEILNRHKNGEIYTVWLTITAVKNDQGKIINYVGSMNDITERKKAKEQAKEHLEKLAHVTRLAMMGEMASGIAHEVNQPLTAISVYTKVSIDLINTENPDLSKLNQTLSKTQQQALRVGRIIHNMKEFGKSHSQRHLTSDINTLIHNAIDLCISEFKHNNITPNFELTDNLPPVVVDHIQIEQVIINLIRNSIDALRDLPPNQHRLLTIQSRLTLNHEILISVKDNGLGIDEEQQQKILTPFHTTKINGTGMGLSISRSLIEAHKGTLCFNSKRGKGSTFYFTLPIKKDKPEKR
ncbi:PAS domain S-box protein [Methylobacter sp.]|uniref:PAS domain S-box protein n=1 Tax=Methylobacter sp. TaxID=2051955 RepID=UPI002FDD4900